MIFDIKGIMQGPELDAFREQWLSALLAENKSVFGKAAISPAQTFVVDLFCGNDRPYGTDFGQQTLSSWGPAQVEFEALSRARNVALAKWFTAQQQQQQPPRSH